MTDFNNSKPEYLNWLTKTDELLKTTDGKSIEVWQLQHEQSNKILSAWAKHFRNHYCLDSEIDCIKEPQTSRKEYLNNIKFPGPKAALGPSIRAGDFGEILVADYLQWLLNYWVPRTRYSNKTIRNESTRGCDVIGFYIASDGKDSKEDTLAIFETKTQFSAKSNKPKLQDAVNSSAEDSLRKAESLNAIKQRLHDQNKPEQAKKIERFQNEADRRYKEVYGAVALFDSPCFNPKVESLTDLSSHQYSDNLKLIIIKGKQMMELVHALYKRAADEA